MRVLLFITGFLSSSIQFILLREFSCLSGGSESTTAIFLALWLVISSAGAIIAKKNDNIDLRKLFSFLIAAPVLSLFLFLLSGKVLVLTGEAVTIPRLVLMLLVTLTPVTVVSAFVFVKLSNLRNDTQQVVPGNSFGIETAGSVVAGILSTLSALLFIGSFGYYFIVLAISAFTAAKVIVRPSVKNTVAFLILPASATVILILTFPPDNLIRNFQLKGIHTTATFDTPYGNITSGIYKDEQTLFYNFQPLFYHNDEVQREEDIHYAMLQSEKHEKILLISGGLSNHLEEIMKYQPEQIDYFEFDPGLLKVEREIGYISDNVNVTIGRKDAFRYLKRSDEDYDIIMQLTDQPLTLTVNRYYSSEYFSCVKANLCEGGVFACSPFIAYNYVSENYITALSSIINALHKSFRNVIAIHGNRLYLIASDLPLRTDICTLVKEKKINNIYVNCDYLSDTDLKDKNNVLLSKIVSTVKPNSLVKPVASWYGNRVMMEKHNSGNRFLIVIIILIFLPLLMLQRATMLMYSSSASLSGLGIIVIFLFQATSGNAHLLSAIILSILFSGLATGAALKNRVKGKVYLYPLGLAFLLAITGLISGLIPQMQVYPLLFMLLPAIVFLAGVMTGAYYRSITTGRVSGVTGRIYGADLSGAASGYLITGTVLIPLAGVLMTSFILSCIILVSLALVSVMPKL